MLASTGVKYPAIVHAQGITETGWFDKNNKVFVENKNWLGLKCAEHRKTYCIGTKYNHAVFNSLAECLLDYIEWQDKYMPRYEEKFGVIDSEDKYYDFLLKWQYAEDKDYIGKIKRVRKILKSFYNE